MGSRVGTLAALALAAVECQPPGSMREEDDVPTYQYACTECGERLEVVQSFSDAALTECPSCAGRLRKVFSGVGVVFKGSGFYRTDSRSGSSEKPAGDKKGAAPAASSGSTTTTAPSTGSSSSPSSSGSSGSSGSTGSSGSSSTSAA